MSIQIYKCPNCKERTFTIGDRIRFKPSKGLVCPKCNRKIHPNKSYRILIILHLLFCIIDIFVFRNSIRLQVYLLLFENIICIILMFSLPFALLNNDDK